jgi:hypothetical protein
MFLILTLLFFTNNIVTNIETKYIEKLLYWSHRKMLWTYKRYSRIFEKNNIQVNQTFWPVEWRKVHFHVTPRRVVYLWT